MSKLSNTVIRKIKYSCYFFVIYTTDVHGWLLSWRNISLTIGQYYTPSSYWLVITSFAIGYVLHNWWLVNSLFTPSLLISLNNDKARITDKNWNNGRNWMSVACTSNTFRLCYEYIVSFKVTILWANKLNIICVFADLLFWKSKWICHCNLKYEIVICHPSCTIPNCYNNG